MHNLRGNVPLPPPDAHERKKRNNCFYCKLLLLTKVQQDEQYHKTEKIDNDPINKRKENSHDCKNSVGQNNACMYVGRSM